MVSLTLKLLHGSECKILLIMSYVNRQKTFMPSSCCSSCSRTLLDTELLANRVNTVIGSHVFHVAAPTICNNLHDTDKVVNSLGVCKRRLKVIFLTPLIQNSVSVSQDSGQQITTRLNKIYCIVLYCVFYLIIKSQFLCPNVPILPSTPETCSLLFE